MQMNFEEFMSLSMNEKLKTVNKLLQKEERDHLKNVSEKVGVPYTAFTKMMRDNGNYQYNQTNKQYEKIMSLDEYNQYLQMRKVEVKESNEALAFLEEHLHELKKLLIKHQDQLILDSEVYDPSYKTPSKSFQVNTTIFEQFTELCSIQFPHLRQRDLVSQCLLDFVRKYKKTALN
jgi:hypothetical protein